MKKFLIAVVALAMALTMAISLSACSTQKEVVIIDVNLTEEEYVIGVNKSNTELKNQLNVWLEELNSADGMQVGDKKVTIKSLYEAEMTAMAEGTEITAISGVKTVSTNRENELVVATETGFKPFEYPTGATADGNNYGGVDMQVAKIFADKLGKELVILDIDFNLVVTNVQQGKADIAMAGLSYSEDRAELVDFTIPYYSTTQKIAVLKEDERLFANCTTAEQVNAVINGLGNVTAGAAKGQTGLLYVEGSDDFGFDGFEKVTPKEYPTILLAVTDLANGKVKFVCGDKDTLAAAVTSANKSVK